MQIDIHGGRGEVMTVCPCGKVKSGEERSELAQQKRNDSAEKMEAQVVLINQNSSYRSLRVCTQ